MLNVWVSKVPLKLGVGPLNLGVGCMLVRFGLKGALHFRDYIRNILHFNRVDLHIL